MGMFLASWIVFSPYDKPMIFSSCCPPTQVKSRLAVSLAQCMVLAVSHKQCGASLVVDFIQMPCRSVCQASPPIHGCLPGIQYLMYTSGTTACPVTQTAPKLVAVPTDTVDSNIESLTKILGPCLLCSCRSLALTSDFSFDPSVVEMYLADACCMALLVLPHLSSSSKLLSRAVSTCCAYRISVLPATPSLLRIMAASHGHGGPWLRQFPSLRLLLVGGEPPPAMLEWARWFGVSGLQSTAMLDTLYTPAIFNLFGTISPPSLLAIYVL